jgi:hypothetical protein
MEVEFPILVPLRHGLKTHVLVHRDTLRPWDGTSLTLGEKIKRAAQMLADAETIRLDVDRRRRNGEVVPYNRTLRGPLTLEEIERMHLQAIAIRSHLATKQEEL